MKSYFYELEVRSNNALKFFVDFVFDLGVVGIELKDNSFIVRDEDNLENIEFALKEYKKALENSLNLSVDLSLNSSKKENFDWIDRYKKGVNPTRVGEFYIRPSWHEPKKELIDIVVDPALAFGSGHHESTNSSLWFISKYKNSYKTALDVGCGSGILSLALAKSGLEVSCCDTDEQAVISTKENFIKNGLKEPKIWLGSVDKAEKQYDIVVANIIADVIFIIKKDLIARTKAGGVLILSGILDKYLERIKAEFSELTCLEILEKNEWVSFVFKRER
ncbi:MAG: 50S ribosomal protein L11 methyltransferase [Campylobacter sp.]|nr:50S ribosomal protein L11 methyltransferase [Campylobacter sp.]